MGSVIFKSGLNVFYIVHEHTQRCTLKGKHQMHLTKSLSYTPPPPTPPTQMQSEKSRKNHPGTVETLLRPDEPTTPNSVIMTGTLTNCQM